MTYLEYYKNLTPIEIRLFKEGYWEFHPPSKADDGIIYCTAKWKAMIAYLADVNKRIIGDLDCHKYITTAQILRCMDNPSLFKKKYIRPIMSYTKKDGSLSIYNKRN